MGKGLKIVAHQEEWVEIIELSGEITKSDEVLPEEILSQDSGIRALVFDFTGVNYINSAGISLLIRLVRMVREKSVAVLAYGLSDHYQKIFKMVGLSNYLYLYPNESAALAAAGLIR